MVVAVALLSRRKLWCSCISFHKPSGSTICWQQRKEILPHTFSDRFFSDEVKRESVISEQPLQIIYNYCDCSHSTHSRCWESTNLDVKSSQHFLFQFLFHFAKVRETISNLPPSGHLTKMYELQYAATVVIFIWASPAQKDQFSA